LVAHVAGIATVTPKIKIVLSISIRNLVETGAGNINPYEFTTLDLCSTVLVFDLCTPFSNGHKQASIFFDTDSVQALLFDLNSGVKGKDLEFLRLSQSKNECSLEKFETSFTVVKLRKYDVGFLSQAEETCFADFDFNPCSGVREDPVTGQKRKVGCHFFPVHLSGRDIGSFSLNVTDSGRIRVPSHDGG